MWMPLKRTAEGHEYHWGYNHLAHFAVTQLLMPLLLRYIHTGCPNKFGIY